MKKAFVLAIAIIIATMTALLGGCTFFDDLFAPSDNEDADNKLHSFVDCLNDEDREGIKSLFAKNKTAEISDFDESIEELLLYYDGEYISVERHSTGVEEDKDSGIERKWYNMSYDVTTDMAIYRMAFYWCAKDAGDSGNVGIESFYIIKATDDPRYPQFTYRGDGSWTSGIPDVKAYDMYTLYVETTYTLYDPEGELVGTGTVGGSDAYALEKYGEYTLVFGAENGAFGGVSTVTESVFVFDRTAPIIVYKGDTTISAKAGKEITFDEIVVYDSVDEDPQYYVFVIERGIYRNITAERKFTFTKKGDYTVRYIAADASDNTSVFDVTVTVK